MKTFFTADTHFRHKNIITYCDRPFHSTEEMDEKMIREWNARVDYNDHIYHLGDVGFASSSKMSDILCRLNGKKFLIRGNHDENMEHEDCSRYFQWIKDVHLLKVQDAGCKEGHQLIWLSHYPHVSWPHIGYGSWNLFGHVHGNYDNVNSRSMDVGVDCWHFAPVDYDYIKHMMRGKIIR